MEQELNLQISVSSQDNSYVQQLREILKVKKKQERKEMKDHKDHLYTEHNLCVCVCQSNAQSDCVHY